MTVATLEIQDYFRSKSQVPAEQNEKRQVRHYEVEDRSVLMAASSASPEEESKLSNELAHRLISDHQADVWRYLRALGCSSDLADDLTQETFLLTLRRPFRYLGPNAAGAYLRRTAYHRFLTHIQQNSKRKSGELTSVAITDATWNQWCGENRKSSEVLDALEICLTKISKRDRLALELRYRDGLSRKEIASEFSMSEHGAKNLLQRAKKRLKSALECHLVHADPSDKPIPAAQNDGAEGKLVACQSKNTRVA